MEKLWRFYIKKEYKFLEESTPSSLRLTYFDISSSRRYGRFDKAFLLAVDINARDLFMDIYYAALDSGQSRLAAAARHKAKLCDEELTAFSGTTTTTLSFL